MSNDKMDKIKSEKRRNTLTNENAPLNRPYIASDEQQILLEARALLDTLYSNNLNGLSFTLCQHSYSTLVLFFSLSLDSRSFRVPTLFDSSFTNIDPPLHSTHIFQMVWSGIDLLMRSQQLFWNLCNCA